MDLTNFHPKKSLGQNFLVNPRVVETIIRAARLTETELVVEVGPGMGALTKTLLKHARRVIAVEKDARLHEWLQTELGKEPRLELIRADALEVAPPQESYFLVANIPYAITSPLLDHFIRHSPQRLPHRAVVLVQKEVAQKICAKPPDMNVLALHVQTFGDPRIVGRVSKNNFRPRPRVDSAIVRIDFPGKPLPPDLKKYFDGIHRGFSQKRKMLRAIFPAPRLQKASIDPTRRAQTLSIEEWLKLAAV